MGLGLLYLLELHLPHAGLLEFGPPIYHIYNKYHPQNLAQKPALKVQVGRVSAQTEGRCLSGQEDWVGRKQTYLCHFCGCFLLPSECVS
jgi:hypothetical protein